MIYTILDAGGFVVRDLDGPEGRSITFRDQMAALLYPAKAKRPALLRIATARRNARDSIDTAAGMARARYITIAPGRDATYAAKYADAAAYAAAGYPADTSNYPWIEAEASQTGLTPDAAAFRIKTTGDFWGRVKGPQIEAVRIAGKDALQGMETAEQINAHRASVINQLNSLADGEQSCRTGFSPCGMGLCPTFIPFIALWWLGIVLAGGDRRSKIALAVDQFWNTPWGGHEDETISSRAEKARLRGDRWGCVLCKWLDKVDPGHCQRALERERASRSLLKTLIFPEKL